MKWIKCSDRLPRLYENVLIYGNGINNHIQTSFLFNNEGHREWQEKYWIPTHWMPLPQPPKDMCNE